MKNLVFIATCALLLFSCQNQAQPKKSTMNTNTATTAKETIYQFKVEDLSGNSFDFASLKGKKIMIVNTASKCGLTPQYKDLEAVYKEYKDKGLVIVGFPANNFASQEPGTNEEIATFCQLNYGVTFPHCPCQNNLRRGRVMFSGNVRNHFIFQRVTVSQCHVRGDVDTVCFRPVNHLTALKIRRKLNLVGRNIVCAYCGNGFFHQRNGEV